MSSRRRAGASTGFTLIEVLVALAVLAITFGFAYRVLSGGFDWVLARIAQLPPGY